MSSLLEVRPKFHSHSWVDSHTCNPNIQRVEAGGTSSHNLLLSEIQYSIVVSNQNHCNSEEILKNHFKGNKQTKRQAVSIYINLKRSMSSVDRPES